VEIKDDMLNAVINTGKANKTLFVRLQQDDLSWWQPIRIHLREAVEITAPYEQSRNSLRFTIKNNTDKLIKGQLIVNRGTKAFERPLELKPGTEYTQMNISPEHIIAGSNEVYFFGRWF
jgi:hypothetical protein